MLYRVFPLREGARPTEEGGPLHVARPRQGSGRHDNPERYGALYASRSPVSAVAERIQPFRGLDLRPEDLRRADGRPLALAALDDTGLGPLVDLDDPRELARRRIRPSTVATRDRSVTRPIALRLHEEGVDGFAWWSVLEASWTNVTLFAERASPRLELASSPEPLTAETPALREAAESLGIGLVG